MIRFLRAVLATAPLLVGYTFLAAFFAILLVAPALAQAAAPAPDLSSLLGILGAAGTPALIAFAVLSLVASIVVAVTPTPSPSSRLWRLYQLLEWLALVTTSTKETGIPAVDALHRAQIAVTLAAKPAAPVDEAAPKPAAPGSSTAAVLFLLCMAGFALSACSYLGLGPNAAPLTPAQVQQNLANINYLFQAAGCAVSAEATTAAPIVQISADATGNQVLAAVNAAGTILCRLTVPPTALPVPAAPNAPPASAPLPTAPPKTS